MVDASLALEGAHCYEVLCSRDRRYDGRFFVGVSTSVVYCRPVCPARTPRARPLPFFASAAGAEAAGHRPCLRCRSELAPGLAPPDAVQQLADQAAGRIRAGALSEGSLDNLPAELGRSPRQIRRAVQRAFGVRTIDLALRTVLGHQVTVVKGATTGYGRFVETFGKAIETALDGLNRLTPVAEPVAGAPIQGLVNLGLTERRAETVHRLAEAAAAIAKSWRPWRAYGAIHGRHGLNAGG